MHVLHSCRVNNAHQRLAAIGHKSATPVDGAPILRAVKVASDAKSASHIDERGQRVK